MTNLLYALSFAYLRDVKYLSAHITLYMTIAVAYPFKQAALTCCYDYDTSVQKETEQASHTLDLFPITLSQTPNSLRESGSSEFGASSCHREGQYLLLRCPLSYHRLLP